MANIFETTIFKKDLLRRVGSIEQIAHIREFELISGKSKNSRIFEVVNGSGLEFTVLGDKCMDIFEMKYKSVPFHFVSKAGLVSSERYSIDSESFTRNFQGGMLYTCGLSNVGPACNEEGTSYGTHGVISHTPADKISVIADWHLDEYMLELQGEIREAALFGKNLVLKRKISTSLGSKSIRIVDTLENQGFEPQSFMLLYHFNFGYPILNDTLRVILPSIYTRRKDNKPCNHNDFQAFSLPIDGKEEEVFYHSVAADQDGTSCVALFNNKLELGVSIKYDTRNLPNLIQWNSMKSGDYALGIEPSNCLPEGRVSEHQRGMMKTIQSFEELKFELELTIIDGRKELEEVEAKINQLV